MSRIGKQPIELPTSVNVTIDPGRVMVSGPLGELQQQVLSLSNQLDATQRNVAG